MAGTLQLTVTCVTYLQQRVGTLIEDFAANLPSRWRRFRGGALVLLLSLWPVPPAFSGSPKVLSKTFAARFK